MLSLLVVAVALTLGAAVAIRLWPIDPVAFHAEPLTATKLSGQHDWLVRPEGGDATAPVYPDSPEDLVGRIAAVALAEPRTTVLAGSAKDTWITFVARSRLMGYPDIISVRAFPQGDGTTLAIWSRSRFGSYDWGVNRARVERWIASLGDPLSE